MVKSQETDVRDSVRMWPGVTAAVVIALIAFVLSFDALRLLFVTCGINPMLSWGGPVCVDGTILLCTWASWGFRKGRIRNPWYPWMGFILFSAFSVMGNALHAWLSSGGALPDWASPVVSSVPPVALMYSTHLVVIIAGDRLDKMAADRARTLPTPGSVLAAPVGEPAVAPPGETKPDAVEQPVVEEPATVTSDDEADTDSFDLWEDLDTLTFSPGDDAGPKAGEADPDGSAAPADVLGGTIAGQDDMTATVLSVPAIVPVPTITAAPPTPAMDTEPAPDPAPVAAIPDVPTVDDPTTDEPDDSEQSDPEPRTEDTDAAQDVDIAPPVAGYPDGVDDEDRAWIDWARGLAASGETTSASKAMDAGLPGATSPSSAKRRLRRLREVWPEVFS